MVVIYPKLLWDNKLIEVSTGTPQTARNIAKNTQLAWAIYVPILFKEQEIYTALNGSNGKCCFLFKNSYAKNSFLPL